MGAYGVSQYGIGYYGISPTETVTLQNKDIVVDKQPITPYGNASLTLQNKDVAIDMQSITIYGSANISLQNMDVSLTFEIVAPKGNASVGMNDMDIVVDNQPITPYGNASIGLDTTTITLDMQSVTPKGSANLGLQNADIDFIMYPILIQVLSYGIINLLGDIPLPVDLRGDVVVAIVGQMASMFSGDDRIIDFTVTQNGLPFNFTASGTNEITFMLKKKVCSTNAIVTKTYTGGEIIFLDPDIGTLQLKLNKEDTENLSGLYYFELQYVDGFNQKSTPATGNIRIDQDGIIT